MLLAETAKFHRAVSDLGRLHTELVVHACEEPPTLRRCDMEKMAAVGEELIELQRVSEQFVKWSRDALAAIHIAVEHLQAIDGCELQCAEMSKLLEAESRTMDRLIAAVC